MSATVALTPEKAHKKYLVAWDVWVLLVPLIAMSPLLLVQFQKLMNRPERQFFPLLIAIALYFPIRHLMSEEGQEERDVTRGRLYWTLSIFSISILIFAVSAWFFSPWLAHVSALGVFLAWALGRCTNVRWSTLAAWTGLLLVTLPLPFGRDEWLVTSLQRASSAACGYALDALNVPHMRSANIIEIKGIQLFVEEACSGIGSLYALLAAAALLLLINRRSFLCSLLVLASVPVWAMLGNFLRLLTIALAQEYYQRDLSHGLDHELLGVVTFSLAALGLWMTEWLLAGFMQPFPPASPEFNFMFQSLNAVLCWPERDPLSLIDEVEDETPQERAARLALERARKETIEARTVRVNLWQQKPVRLLTRIAAGLTLIFGILPAVVVSRDASPSMLSFGLTEYSKEQLEKMPKKESMPALLGEWKQVAFASETRSTASALGAHSLIWEYRKLDQRFLLSMDFPFRGYHPLEVCYGNSGWNVSNVGAQTDPSASKWDWRELTMDNQFGSRGFVCYSLMTEDCQPFGNVIESDVKMNLAGRMGALFGPNAERSSPVFQPVCYQIQIICESGRKLSAEELEDLRQQFFTARELLREKVKIPDPA